MRPRAIQVPPGFLGCTTCRAIKPESEFFRRSSTHFESQCKTCKMAMKHSMKEVPLAVLEQRFWERVDKRGPNECWPWTGAKSKGYGYIYTGGRPFQQRAHRVSLMLHGVKLPPGTKQHKDLVCDHLCENKACVNPAHIELVTQAVNTWRGTRKNIGKPHPTRRK